MGKGGLQRKRKGRSRWESPVMLDYEAWSRSHSGSMRRANWGIEPRSRVCVFSDHLRLPLKQSLIPCSNLNPLVYKMCVSQLLKPPWAGISSVVKSTKVLWLLSILYISNSPWRHSQFLVQSKGMHSPYQETGHQGLHRPQTHLQTENLLGS